MRSKLKEWSDSQGWLWSSSRKGIPFSEWEGAEKTADEARLDGIEVEVFYDDGWVVKEIRSPNEEENDEEEEDREILRRVGDTCECKVCVERRRELGPMVGADFLRTILYLGCKVKSGAMREADGFPSELQLD